MNKTVSELLLAYKADQGLGDKRLADRANDYAGSSLLHRSSIRNWSNGSSLVARNWRQIAAIAAALRLEMPAATELLEAAGCLSVDELRRTASPQDRHLLRFWDDPDDGASATGLVTLDRVPDRSAPTVAPVRSRRSQIAAVAAIALLVFAVVGLLIRQGGGSDEVLGTTQDAPVGVESLSVPAVASFRAPLDGAVVGTEPALSGTADHPNGISHVHLILQRLDLGVYWNPDDQIWQQKFRVFVVPVDSPGSSVVNWIERIDNDHPLPPGPYRARVWAAGSDGNLDPVGQLVEFEVAERADQDNPAVQSSIELQENAVLDERRVAEQSGADIVKVRVRQPINGMMRADGAMRVVAFAEHATGVDVLRVEVFDVSNRSYWNFEAERWQTTAVALEVSEPVPGGDGTRLEVDMWLPSGFAEPGQYTVTAFGVASGAEPFVGGESSEVALLGG